MRPILRSALIFRTSYSKNCRPKKWDSSQIGSISTGAMPTLTSSITGQATPNSTVTCAAKLQTDWNTSKLRYAWFKNDVRISGQSKKGYVVSSRDKGAKLSCRVSVTLEPAYTQLGAVSPSVKIR